MFVYFKKFKLFKYGSVYSSFYSFRTLCDSILNRRTKYWKKTFHFNFKWFYLVRTIIIVTAQGKFKNVMQFYSRQTFEQFMIWKNIVCAQFFFISTLKQIWSNSRHEPRISVSMTGVIHIKRLNYNHHQHIIIECRHP